MQYEVSGPSRIQLGGLNLFVSCFYEMGDAGGGLYSVLRTPVGFCCARCIMPDSLLPYRLVLGGGLVTPPRYRRYPPVRCEVFLLTGLRRSRRQQAGGR